MGLTHPIRSRLKAKNLLYINQLLQVLSCFLTVLQGKYAMLCHIVSCCVTLCHTVSHCVMLCHTIT